MSKKYEFIEETDAKIYGETHISENTIQQDDSQNPGKDEVSELIHTLEENDMPEHARLLKGLCEQIDTMSEQLQDMSVRLSEAEWQLRESGIDIHEAVAALKKENRTLRERLSDIRKSIASKAADIMESVKKVGRKALYRTVEFMGIMPALQNARDMVRENIKHLDARIDKIERVGTSLRETGRNIRNAFRAMRGKEPLQDTPEKGISKTDMLKKPFEAMRERYIGMEEKLAVFIEEIGQFGEQVILENIPKDMTWEEKLAFTDMDEIQAFINLPDSDYELYEDLRYEQDWFLEKMEQAEGKGEKIAKPDRETCEKILRQQMQTYMRGIHNLQDGTYHFPAGYSQEEYAKLVTQRYHDFRMEIHANGYKPSWDKELSWRMQSLMEVVDVLDADTGKHNTLQDIKEMAVNPDVPEVQRMEAQEVVRALQETGGWLDLKAYYRIPEEMVSRKNAIRQELRGNGFKPNKALVANIERLDVVTGRRNTIQSIKGLAENPDISAEAKAVAGEITDQLQRQEVQMQAPEPPAVEPA